MHGILCANEKVCQLENCLTVRLYEIFVCQHSEKGGFAAQLRQLARGSAQQ